MDGVELMPVLSQVAERVALVHVERVVGLDGNVHTEDVPAGAVNQGRLYVNLIPEGRRLLAATGLPTVMENVQGSDLRRDLTLCGEMFGLDVIRHRYFELDGFAAEAPKHKPHRGRVRGWRHGTYYDGPYVAVYGDGGGKGSVAEWQQAMGIDWTDVRVEIAEAIPPAYTEYIGAQLLVSVEAARTERGVA